jgi:DNA primase large subunit
MTLMGDPPNTTYYRVPFEEALELVQRRQCFLHQGEAYIARTHLVSIVALKFRIYLSHQMAATLRSSTHVRKDKRVTPLLNMLAQQHVGPTFKTGFGSNVVSVKEIPGLSERSFPLCMHVPNKELHKNAHLRHGGRMQLGLFLKGIGLSLEEALTYWQKAFSRKTDASKFQKQYAYNIRHNYGQEGKRASYTPYSCMKIINGAPGQGEHHGCPFRHYDVNNLKMKLRERRVPANQIKEITDLVKGSHFQIACTRYFSATHNNTEPEEPINHPNSYFNSSMKFHKAAAELANPGDANSSNSTSITSLPSAQNSSSSSFDVKKSVP